MYARPLFVVVGIFRAFFKPEPAPHFDAGWIPVRVKKTRPAKSGTVLARFGYFRTAVLGLRLGIVRGCGYTLAA
jgi:hypothetical protein